MLLIIWIFIQSVVSTSGVAIVHHNKLENTHLKSRLPRQAISLTTSSAAVRIAPYWYQYASPGDVVHVTCCLPYEHDVDAAAIKSITWHRDGTLLQGSASSRVQISSGGSCATSRHFPNLAGFLSVLTVTDMKRSDQGSYKCSFNTTQSRVYANSSHVEVLSYCTDPPHFRTDLNAPRPSYNVNYGDRLEISCQLECGDLVYISKFLRKANGGLNVSNLDRTNIHRLEFDEQRQQTKELYRRTWVLESVTDQHNGEWSCQGGDLDRPVEQRFHIHVKGSAAPSRIQLKVLKKNAAEGGITAVESATTYHTNIFVATGDQALQFRIRCIADRDWDLMWAGRDGQPMEFGPQWRVTERMRDGKRVSTVRLRRALRVEDFGEYACVGSHGQESSVHTFSIKAGSPPSRPPSGSFHHDKAQYES